MTYSRLTLQVQREASHRKTAKVEISIIQAAMYTIDLILRHVPMPVGIERKESAAAETLYQQISQAMTSGSPAVLELTCDRQVGKKLTVRTTEIVAVQITDKDAPAAVTSRGGFFAQLVQPPST